MAKFDKRQQLNRLAFMASPPYFAHMVVVQLRRVEEDQANALEAARAASSPRPEDRFGGHEDFQAYLLWLGRLRMDAHLLMIGVGALLKLARKYAKLTGDARVDKAERAFLAIAPQAKHMRDVFEHADEYVLGDGRLQRNGAIPDEAEIRVDLTGPEPADEIELLLNPWKIPLKALSRAAIQLARDLDAVWSDHEGTFSA
jgi:hypothetical protein